MKSDAHTYWLDLLVTLLRDKGVVTDEELDAIRDRAAAQYGIKIEIKETA